MEKYSQIIVLSYTYTTNNKNILVINEDVILEDDTHLICDNDVYTFDYLIFTNSSLISNFYDCHILQENSIPVTNCLYQTSIENIYYTLDNKIKTAIENIFNND